MAVTIISDDSFNNLQINLTRAEVVLSLFIDAVLDWNTDQMPPGELDKLFTILIFLHELVSKSKKLLEVPD